MLSVFFSLAMTQTALNNLQLQITLRIKILVRNRYTMCPLGPKGRVWWKKTRPKNLTLLYVPLINASICTHCLNIQIIFLHWFTMHSFAIFSSRGLYYCWRYLGSVDFQAHLPLPFIISLYMSSSSSRHLHQLFHIIHVNISTFLKFYKFLYTDAAVLWRSWTIFKNACYNWMQEK